MAKELEIPEVFEPLFTAPKRKNILYGGRGSAKSHTVARFCVLRSCEKKIRILCTRELQKSIAESVHQLISDCIHKMGLDAQFNVQRDKIYNRRTGSEFIFAGVRQNTNEIKSMEDITICWVEEAQAMSQQSLDVLVPTIRSPGSILIFTFNPFKDSDPVYQMMKTAVDTQDPDILVINANHDDNPFFPEELRLEMERDKKNDYDKYLWVWEGQCLGISAAQIFRGKYEVKEFETPSNAIFHYGADWGFSNDPTAIIRSFIIGNTLYIDYEAGEVGCDLDKTPDLFNQVPGAMLYPIYADCARPETISFMNSRKFNVIAAEKWSGSIEDGISYLKSFNKIVIHPRCKNTIEEFDLYQYKVDRQTNEVLREPLDRYNHWIDALRYSHTTSMRAQSNGKVYDEFSMDNIVHDVIVVGEVYIATFILPGRTYAVAVSIIKGKMTVVADYEIKGEVSFDKLKSLFWAKVHLIWLPFSTLEDVPPNLVQECIDADIEPAVGSVLPTENEATVLANRLFASKNLQIFESATMVINALTERVYQSGGNLENNQQAKTQTVQVSELFEYAIWRVAGRFME